MLHSARSDSHLIKIFAVIIFIMLYALGGKAGYVPSAQTPLEDHGKDYIADVLSFGGIVFGSLTGVRPVSSAIIKK